MIQYKQTKSGGYNLSLIVNGKRYKKYTHPSRNTDSRVLFDLKQLIEVAEGIKTHNQVVVC